MLESPASGNELMMPILEFPVPPDTPAALFQAFDNLGSGSVSGLIPRHQVAASLVFEGKEVLHPSKITQLHPDLNSLEMGIALAHAAEDIFPKPSGDIPSGKYMMEWIRLARRHHLER